MTDTIAKQPYYGRAVDLTTRRVRYLSVTAMEKADMHTSQGCLRKWWYQYVGGIKEPPTTATERGTRLHDEIATYLQTGVKALSQTILINLRMVPDPGPDLAIEHSIVPLHPDGNPDLSGAVLTAAGIPLIGKIDCAHYRRINKGVADVDDTMDPEKTVEVIDWKFPNTMDYAKSGPDLVKTIQMSGYGEYVFRSTDSRFVRLSHGYMPVRGSGRKMTTRVDRETIAKAWEHPEGVARSIVDVAKEVDPDKVPANTKACFAFRRDCVNKPHCKAVSHNSIASYIGQTAARDLLSDPTANSPLVQLGRNRSAMIEGSTPMAPVKGFLQREGAMALSPSTAGAQLLARIKSKAAGGTATAQATTPQVDPEEIARLKAEEAAAKLRAMMPEGFAEALGKVEQLGADLKMGFPMVSGKMAECVAAVRGYTGYSGDGLAGSGDVADVILREPDQIFEFLAELEAVAASAATSDLTDAPAALLPPDAPISNPTLASKPPQTDASALSGVIAQGEGKRKRRTKAEMEAARGESTGIDTSTGTPAAYVTDGVISGEQVAVGHTVVDASFIDTTFDAKYDSVMPAIYFYQDCTPSVAYKCLDAWVADTAAALASSVGADDIRCAPNDGPLGFGRWKGALAAYIRTKSLPAGNYQLDTRGSEIAEVAAEAIRGIALASGGIVVRGR